MMHALCKSMKFFLCSTQLAVISSLQFCFRGGGYVLKQILRFSLAVCFLSWSAFAQRDLATILGTVTDPQGGVIGNAKVTLTEEATGVSYEVTTDQNGDFI